MCYVRRFDRTLMAHQFQLLRFRLRRIPVQSTLYGIWWDNLFGHSYHCVGSTPILHRLGTAASAVAAPCLTNHSSRTPQVASA